jgi:predicted Zn-dependent peptidase
VITQEAWGRFHNEKFLQYIRECNNNLYPPHSNLRRFFSALGWPTTIKNITHSDIVTWHKNYGKNNMTLVVVGNVDQTTFSELKKFLKQAPPGKKYSLKKEKSVPPVSKEFRKHGDDIGDIREQAEINITRTHSPFSKQLYGTRYIFSRILKDILYEKIREERGLCYGLDFRISTTQTYADIGFNVTTDEKNIETIIEQFWSIVHDIQKGIYKKRFDNIKNMLIEKERSAEVLSYDIANDALEQILKYDGEIITSAETVTMLKKTTYADIVAFSKKVLDKKYIFTEIILPSKKTK